MTVFSLCFARSPRVHRAVDVMEAVLSASHSCTPRALGQLSVSTFRASPSMAMSSPFFGSPLMQRAGAMRTYNNAGRLLRVVAMDSGKSNTTVPYASYAVPLESAKESSFITRPLAEILRDMNKRVPDKVLKTRNDEGVVLKYIPWYCLSPSSISSSNILYPCHWMRFSVT